MKAKEFFDTVRSRNEACERLWKILKEEEHWAGISSLNTAEAVHASGFGDPTARAFDRLSLLRSRYQEACSNAMAYAMYCEHVLAQLPDPAWEEAVRGRCVRDESARAVADAMDCSEGTVRTAIRQALEWLDEHKVIDRVMAGDPFDDVQPKADDATAAAEHEQ